MYVLEKRKVNIFVYYNVNAYKTVSKNSSIKIRSVHSRKMKMEKDYCTFFSNNLKYKLVTKKLLNIKCTNHNLHKKINAQYKYSIRKDNIKVKCSLPFPVEHFQNRSNKNIYFLFFLPY